MTGAASTPVKDSGQPVNDRAAAAKGNGRPTNGHPPPAANGRPLSPNPR
ncbi:MAG: hypothetical protein IPH82_26700 [Chloroflexi bacterium]|nr:hypothetical protein [Chloroflexota bacterium]